MKRWRTILWLAMSALLMIGTVKANAQGETSLQENFENFLILIEEREETGEDITVYDAIEYFGQDYEYLPPMEGYSETLMYDFYETDGGSFLMFQVQDDEAVLLYSANILISDETFDPIDPDEFQDWMADFLTQDLTDFDAVTEGHPLTLLNYIGYTDGTSDLQYIYDYFAVSTMIERDDEINFYTFRHLNDMEGYDEITDEDVETLESQSDDLHIDDIRELLGEYWRGLYYLEEGNLAYYWHPLEGYTVYAHVDEEGNVINLDILPLETGTVNEDGTAVN